MSLLLPVNPVDSIDSEIDRLTKVRALLSTDGTKKTETPAAKMRR